ncbi:restriction endonuclease subunit S [Tenacibaculum finnmarkense]|uniref:restriction endonuclease subunit S n=2 Tax=Tenacibaculum finnmarkense TaxID=2781243 RepID=UPI001EFAF4C3|nr:restriction endonuclease subunit S [Tenacibaculum finnmarkense]MCG8829800.1 restriction endonuclease subunit S [Tenacibaculum finnmarkense]
MNCKISKAKSNYRKIGDFIQQVNIKNDDGSIKLLLGVNLDKKFIPSVANTIGTDMTKYKVIKKGQFGCKLMSVGRDKKLPISRLINNEKAIISSAYYVFEVIDENILSPEYLMMWFQRPESDRYLWFQSGGDIRGRITWDDLCQLPIKIPSIEKQHEIVKEYNTVANRITLNETINKKLEDTAQALYKHWFVDFEFPNEQGKPYKSNGGKMIFNEELDLEIPLGWEVKKIDSLIDYNSSNYNKDDNFKSIYYLDTSSITENKIEELQHLILNQHIIPSRAKRKVEHNDIVYSTIRPNLKHYGLIKNPKENMLVSTGFMVIKPKKNKISSELLFLCLTSKEITKYLQAKAEMSVSTYPSIKPEDILEIKLTLPNESNNNLLENIEINLKPFYLNHWIKNEENKKLLEIKNLLLSKMSKVAIEKETVC